MLRVIGIYNFEFRMFRPLVYRALEDYIGFLLPHRRQSRHWLIFLSLFKSDLFFEPWIQIFFQLYAHRKRKSWQVLVRSFRMFQPLVYRDLEDYIGFLLLHWRQYRHWLIFLSLLKLNLFLVPWIHIFFQLYAHRKRKSMQVYSNIFVRFLEELRIIFLKLTNF